MAKQTELILIDQIQPLIISIRDQNVILDRDLAALYGVPTKRLNEQVKRNRQRFPEDFVIRLTSDEADGLATLEAGGGMRPPHSRGTSCHGYVRRNRRRA